MAFAKYGLASRAPEIGRSLLIFASLGIFSKLLNVDLSSMDIFGASFDPAYPELLPGFIGLVVIYLFITFCIARLEGLVEQKLNGEAADVIGKVRQSKRLIGVMVFAFPFAIFVYSMPYVVGVYALYLLGPDSLSVLGVLWRLLS